MAKMSVAQPTKTFRIKDIYLAAFVSSLGFQGSIVPTDAQHSNGVGGQLVEFSFSDDLDQALTLAYFQDIELNVGDQTFTFSVSKLFMALKQLRYTLNNVRTQ